jgi:rhodanese-related sulfurtransferase
MALTVEQMLELARARLVRVEPARAAEELAAGACLVDIRPIGQRAADGEIPGATVIDRNVLEWRLAPSSEWRLEAVAKSDARVILICNQGYQSSLAAAALQELGLCNATDVIGGFEAWRAAGLPTRSSSEV